MQASDITFVFPNHILEFGSLLLCNEAYELANEKVWLLIPLI